MKYVVTNVNKTGTLITKYQVWDTRPFGGLINFKNKNRLEMIYLIVKHEGEVFSRSTLR